MMDVSMYGQHSTPSYNTADTNFYNYNGASEHSVPPHHQYPGATTGGYVAGAAYHSGSYEESSYLYGEFNYIDRVIPTEQKCKESYSKKLWIKEPSHSFFFQKF